MRAFLSGCAILALAACQPEIPDSAAGVGFDNANLSPRPAPVATPVVPASPVVSQETVPTAAPVQVARGQVSVPKPTQTQSASRTAKPMTFTPFGRQKTAPSATRTAAAASVPAAAVPASAVPVATSSTRQTSAEPPAPKVRAPGQPQTTPDGIVHASPNNPPPPVLDNPGLSDENNFAAVGARRSIADDAARLKANRANYQVIAPTAVPARTGAGPNIVEYALATRHPVGQKVYRRMSFLTAGRYKKACAAYPSAQEAQEAFLGKGGPKVDRLGLDPDGDGYACQWSPEPYRKAARGG